jgi:type I restriction enzyme M protein
MIIGELKGQVDKIWLSFTAGGLSNPLTVIEQFTYLLFIRRLDETQLLEEKKANMIGTVIDNPIFTKEQSDLRWNRFKDRDPETMFDLFTKPRGNRPTVFDHMKELNGRAGAFSRYMKGATVKRNKIQGRVANST